MNGGGAILFSISDKFNNKSKFSEEKFERPSVVGAVDVLSDGNKKPSSDGKKKT